MSQVHECKQLSAQGMSIRAISRKLEVSRNTVRRYLRGEAVPGVYQLREGRPQPVRERIQARIREMLVEEFEKKTPRKQRLTASRIHRLLEKEGFHAGESTVRRVVRETRRDLQDFLDRAYLPLAYDPAHDAQVDFFEAVVDDVCHGRRKQYLLVVRACYSGRSYIYAAPNQTREALLEGLMRAFEFFGGVFHVLWFDNLTPAVRKVLKGRTRQLQRAFESFQAHHGFRAEFCAPGKGNEKGGVENHVKFARHEILTPIPTVNSRADVQKLCDEYVAEEAERTARGQTRTIGDLWQDEVPGLLPLPAARFDAATLRTGKVSNRSWVSVGTNYYSVPVDLVGHTVGIKVDAEEVAILDRQAVRARHRRIHGREQMSLSIEHYLPLLERKSRGLDRAIPVRRFLDEAPPVWRQLLRALRQQHGEIQGSQSFVKALQLCETHGVDAVSKAIQLAVGHTNLSMAVVRYYLGQEKEASTTSCPPFDYDGPTVRSVCLADYAVLCGAAEVSHG